MEPHRLDIAFVSDVACPWCAIGLASLDQALARLTGEFETTLRVEPFELNPDMSTEGAEVMPYLASKYGRTPEQVAQVQARIRERGAAVGFALAIASTCGIPSMRTGSCTGPGSRGVRPSSSAHCCAPITARAAIRAPRKCSCSSRARSAWIAARAKAILDGDEFTSEVRARERYWLQRGVAGVPLVVVNGTHAIEGAETPEGYERALRQIARSHA